MGQVSGIKQLTITVQDLARAKRFYEETLGLTHLFQAGPMEFFDCNGARLLLAMAEGGHSGMSIIYFNVDDIEG